jgi:hypothetical protein
MTSIANLSSPIITILDDNYINCECEIRASAQQTGCIDVRVDNKKPVIIVTSSKGYSDLNQCTKNRSNINSEEIRIYGYRASKAIGRIQPGSNSFGNVSYPQFNGSTLGEIDIMPIVSDSKLFIIIDQYDFLTSEGCPDLKRMIVSKDINTFTQKIRDACGASVTDVCMVIDKKIFDKIHSMGLIDEFVNSNSVFPFQIVCGNSISDINNILCDRVFGRQIGGKTQSYIGLLESNYEIIDADFTSNNRANTMCINMRGQNAINLNGNGNITISMTTNDEQLFVASLTIICCKYT